MSSESDKMLWDGKLSTLSGSLCEEQLAVLSGLLGET